MKQAIAVVLILLAWAGPARAWSEDGHRIVCAIAWKELIPETRALVDGLLEKDRASGFPEACLWADAIRGDPAYGWAKPHHYVNVPQGGAGIDLERDCPPEPGCIIRAITTHIGTLRDEKTSAADKAQALKFLGHFIGDIHQPLHAGRAEDRGGTAIRVRFLGWETSLHAVWDGGLIAQMGSDWRALADRLHAGILDAGRVTWQRSDVQDWAEESHRLAMTRAYVEPESGWILGPDYNMARERAGGCRAAQESWRAAGLDPAGSPWSAFQEDRMIRRQCPPQRRSAAAAARAGQRGAAPTPTRHAAYSRAGPHAQGTA